MIPQFIRAGRYGWTLLWITVKRIIRNWRLVAPLLIGLILASAFVAAVPIYSSASLQSSFLNSWLEQDSFRAPFAVIPSYRNPRRRNPVNLADINRLERYLDLSLSDAVGLPPTNFSSYMTFGDDVLLLSAEPDLERRIDRADLGTMSNLRLHTELISGRWFEERSDGVVEVMVGSRTLDELELLVGSRYWWAYTLRVDERIDEGEMGSVSITETSIDGQRYAAIPIQVVGSIQPESGTTSRDLIYPLLPDRLFVRGEPFVRLQQAGLRIDRADWQWVFDDRRVQVADLGRLITDLEAIEVSVGQMVPGTKFWLSPLEFFRSFKPILDQVSLFLLSLAAPTLMMIVGYVMLMAASSVEQRITEVTTLHSRGAGRLQVLTSFSIEWALLAAVAALVGPYIGLLAARTVGSFEGVLCFGSVAGTAWESGIWSLRVTNQSRTFSVIASFLAVAAALGPVAASGRLSVVTLRHFRARGMQNSFWHRYFIDVIVLGLAVYGYSGLRWQSIRLSPNSIVDAEPLLFVVPTLFFLGFGLFLLRLFPVVMAGISRLSFIVRGTVWQLTFRRLARNTGPFVSVVALLIITVSMGLYNGSAARTLQQNMADRIMYQTGAEVVVIESWEDIDDEDIEPARSRDEPRMVASSEPPWLSRGDIPGVEAAARVLFRHADASMGVRELGEVSLLALIPSEFVRTAWHRGDLFPHGFPEYLVALARHREGVLLSQSLATRYNVSLGDSLTLEYQRQPIDVYVIGIVPYWPSLDPTERPFVVANLEHVQDFTVLEPYETWYSINEELFAPLTGKSTGDMLAERLSALGIGGEKVIDARHQLAELQKEPYRRGFFGVLSIGFIAAAAVTVLALMFSTISSTREQSVQLAALRANGLSALQTAGVIAAERFLTVGIGVVLGVLAARIATILFLPLLRDRAMEVGNVPPYIVVTDVADLTVLLVVMAAGLSIVVIAAAVFIGRNQVAGAVRLGEEP